MTIRTRIGGFAFKVETTIGTDAIAGTPATDDWVTCSATMRFLQDQTPNPSYNASYDDLPPIPGGLRAEINVSLPMAGSGADTAPEWGKLLQACRMVETLRSLLGTSSGTAATAGSSTTATLQSPFAATSQLYRGMPVLITGNPATETLDGIVDYTDGRVATFGRTYSPVLGTSTLVRIPACIRYSPTSDETLEKTLTCYAYVDGLRHKVVGCRGSWSIALTAGRPAVLNVRLTGIVVTYNEAVAVPTTFVPVTRQAPRWAAGMSRLNRALAQCQSLSADGGVRTAYVDNPEATEGYDPPIITGAGPRITIDPLGNTTNTPTRTTAFRVGTEVPLVVSWGSTAGNRFMLMCPAAQVVDLQPGERTGLGVDAIALAPTKPDAGIFLTMF